MIETSGVADVAYLLIVRNLAFWSGSTSLFLESEEGYGFVILDEEQSEDEIMCGRSLHGIP